MAAFIKAIIGSFITMMFLLIISQEFIKIPDFLAGEITMFVVMLILYNGKHKTKRSKAN